MSESLNLCLKAREIIVSRSHEELAIIVDHLFTRQESEEYKNARALFDFCVSYTLNCLTIKLLKVYQSSSNGVTRFRSIYLLSEALTDSRTRNFNFFPDSLYEIKPLLIECLVMQETKESDIKIFRRIVYFIAYDVVVLHKDKWDELGDCILSLTNSKEPVKAFHIFIDLPQVYRGFIDKFLHQILEKAGNVFFDPKLDRVQVWSLALQILVKMWIQLLNTEMRFELIDALMSVRLTTVMISVKKLVEKGKEQFLLRVLVDFERFFSAEMKMYHHSKDQCHFVLKFVSEMEKVRRVGKETKEIVRKIKMLVTVPQTSKDDVKNPRVEFDSSWNDHLKSLSSLEVLKIFASTELEDRSREIAIRRVNVLLSDHFSKKAIIDVLEFRELQPLLISCLKEEGVSESMFKVLGEVLNHVALEMFVYQREKWYDLRDYVASRSKTEFHRAVYVFQCLTMPFLDGKFLDPMMEKLLPEISSRLEPPTESLVDDSHWVLAFTGAFCAIIKLIEDPGYNEQVKEIAHKMIEAMRNLVERGMEVGIVRRAFRDVETIVQKQFEWYGNCEYQFIKGLLWRLYAIKGMSMGSKIVLWRINVRVEKRMINIRKKLPKEDEFDWLNIRNPDDAEDDDAEDDDDDDDDGEDEDDDDEDDDDEDGDDDENDEGKE